MIKKSLHLANSILTSGRRPRFRRLTDLVIALLVLGVLTLMVARVPPQQVVGKLEGIVSVIDGDSLVLDGVRIRLKGIDAPELDQTCTKNSPDKDSAEDANGVYSCGEQARYFLIQLIGDRTVACDSLGRDRYGRVLARCMAGETGLNPAMVEAGWAIAYGDYHAQERQARREGKGLWRGDFISPQEWRRATEEATKPSQKMLSCFWNWLRSWLQF